MSDQSDLSDFSICDVDDQESETNPADEKLYKSEEWLREQYHENELTQSEIGDKVDVSQKTVGNWMRKHGIERRSVTEIQTEGNLEPLKSDEWLHEQYYEQEKTVDRIADELNLAQSTVRTWMDNHGIEPRSTAESLTDGDIESLKNEQWLREQYCELQKTSHEIADERGLAKTTVLKWMREHGIERRSRVEARTDGDIESLKNEQWLREQYCKCEKTVSQIANELSLSPTPVRRWMKEHGIERRSPAESQTDGDLKLLKNEEWLREQYCERERTTREIADETGVSQRTVTNWMDKHGIERRSLSKSHTDGDVESLKNEEWLRSQYCEQKKTIDELSDELNLSQTTVRKWLNIHDIEIRSLYMNPDHLSHQVIGEFERDIATRLHNSEVAYQYESEEIEYGEDRTYIPDFVTEDYIIECKGADWGTMHSTGVTAEQKARAAMRQLDDREYVVVGIELPCDIHVPWDKRETIHELF